MDDELNKSIVPEGQDSTKEIETYPQSLQYAEAMQYFIGEREPDDRGYYKIEIRGPNKIREAAVIRKITHYRDGAVGTSDWITRGSTGEPAEVELKFEQGPGGEFKEYPTDEELEEKGMADIAQTIRGLSEKEGSRIDINNKTAVVSHNGVWMHREDIGDSFESMVRQLDDEGSKNAPRISPGTPS